MANLATEFYENDFSWDELRAAREEEWTNAEEIITTPDVNNNACKVWDSLYNARGSAMFKPRRYILKAFPEIESELASSKDEQVRILDCGSGNGASIFPLLRHHNNNNSRRRLAITALDVSQSALDLVQREAAALDGVSTISTVRYDLCDAESPPPLPLPPSYDLAMLIFTLSAIPAHSHQRALLNCVHALRPGGRLLFRDYGCMDMIQLRSKHNKLSATTVRKEDGVLCTFFTRERVADLFALAGLGLQCAPKYCTVRNVNRKTQQTLHRVFIQAVGIKL